ncbi:MAG TPA: RpiB/LacA/LacB family sugar-phosphate isomerase [Candidatus Dormibacteraeota bacterium]|nr:RpiB/LacA/LacB family sugar-phosphate isomerase [Candidatus Dormibacteraeota bacterium]
MKVFLGTDHNGFEMKNAIREHLQHSNYEVEDKGAITLDAADDYPKYAYSVATEVLGEEKAFGILVCGSGQGMAIAANRVRGIRAALIWSPAEARAARHDDDANILVLPAHMIDMDTALAIVDNFLEQAFSGEERYVRRIQQIEQLYG